jgi:hypothetical protein
MPGMNYNCYLDRIVVWAEERGYSVFFERDGDDSVDCESKIISIKSTNRLETQLHVLLHECGHVLVRTNGSAFQYDEVTGSYSEKSKTSKTFVLIEEVEAWRRGYLLAKRLGVSIDDKKWNRSVASAIWKYADWTSS